MKRSETTGNVRIGNGTGVVGGASMLVVVGIVLVCSGVVHLASAWLKDLASMETPVTFGAIPQDASHAYAMLADGDATYPDGTLVFFRSATDYSDGGNVQVETSVEDVDGNTHVGTLFVGVEDSGQGNAPWHDYAGAISSVSMASGQVIRPTSTANWFAGCEELASVDLSELDTRGAVSMANMFANCDSLASVTLGINSTLVGNGNLGSSGKARLPGASAGSAGSWVRVKNANGAACDLIAYTPEQLVSAYDLTASASEPSVARTALAGTYVRGYVVSYDANGGTDAPDAQLKEHGVDLTLSGTTPRPASPSESSVTVTFDAGGGSAQSASASATRTTTHTFGAWHESPTATNDDGYAPNDTYGRNESVTLYAAWTDTVTTTSVKLPEATYGERELLGWYDGSTRVGGAGDSYTPTSSVTLHAEWSGLPFVVTLVNGSGALGETSVTVRPNHGELVSVVVPWRTDGARKYFGGYYASVAGTGNALIDAEGKGTTELGTLSEGATLYAKWVSEAVTTKYGTQGAYTFTASRAGWYKLEGWGAEGGRWTTGGGAEMGDNSGAGGYTRGTVYLAQGETVHVVVGGVGADGSMGGYDGTNANEVKTAPGGYNGGGAGMWDGGEYNKSSYSDESEYSGGGGGATHFASVDGLLPDLKDSSTKVLLVAGGGGGGSSPNDHDFRAGGGGGREGGAPLLLSNNGSSVQVTGSAATQTSGYKFGQGQDGTVTQWCGTGGGGGGWYGGRVVTGYSTGANGNLGGGGSGRVGGNSSNTAIDSTTGLAAEASYIDAGGRIRAIYDGGSWRKDLSAHDEYWINSPGYNGNGYARVTYVPARTYILENGDGSTPVRDTVEVLPGFGESAKATVPTNGKKRFLGYYDNPEGTGRMLIDSGGYGTSALDEVVGTITLYAKWGSRGGLVAYGSAYAVLDADRVLTLFRSEESYRAGAVEGAVDVMGNEYSGYLVTINETKSNGLGIATTNIKAARVVRIAEGQEVSLAYCVGLFSGFTKLKTADLYGLNLSGLRNVTATDKGLYQMFSGCTELERVCLDGVEMPDWCESDSDKKTSMREMFKDCKSLPSVGVCDAGVTGLSLSGATSLASMFSGCSQLTTVEFDGLDLKGASGTGSGGGLYRMFYNCKLLTNAVFDGMSLSDTATTTMYQMFYGCSSLRFVGQSDEGVSGLDFSGASTLEGLFQGCSALTEVNLGYVSQPTVATTTVSVANMFAGCMELTSLDLSEWDFTKYSNIGTMITGTSGNCTKLATVDLSWATVGNGVGLLDGLPALSYLNLSYATITKVYASSTSTMLYQSGTATDASGKPLPMEVDLSSADLSECPSLAYLFGGCANLTRVHLDGAVLPDEKTLSMEYMFYNCQNLPSVGVPDEGVSGLDFSRASSLANMFKNCKALGTVILSGMTFPEGSASAANMFAGCTALRTLNLSNTNLSQLTNKDSMIPGTSGNCVSLAEVDLSGATVGSGVSLLDGLPALSRVDLSTASFTSVYKSNTETLLCNSGTATDENGSPIPMEVNLSYAKLSECPSLAYLFNGCANLTRVKFDDAELPETIPMQYLFNNCANLPSVGVPDEGVTGLDLSRATNVAGMFAGSGLVTALLNSCDLRAVSGTSSGTGLHRMFYNCTRLENIELSSATMPEQAANAAEMFAGCSKLRTLDLNNIDISNLTGKDSMIPSSCAKLAEVNLSSTTIGDGSKLLDGLPALSYADLRYAVIAKVYASATATLFYNSGTATDDEGKPLPMEVDLRNADLSACTSLAYLFNGCANLTRVHLDGMALPDETTLSMEFMFYNCKNLPSVGVSDEGVSGLSLVRASSMSNLFNGCLALEEADLSGAGIPEREVSAANMFKGCSALRRLNLSYADISYLKDKSSMIPGTSGNCVSLAEVDLYHATVGDGSQLLDGLPALSYVDLSDADVDKVYYRYSTTTGSGKNETTTWHYYSIFYGSGKQADELEVDLVGAKLEDCPSFNRFFYECTKLTRVRFDGATLPAAATWDSMFYGCTSLKYVGPDDGVSGLDLSGATSLNYMFSGCSSLEEVDLSRVQMPVDNGSVSASDMFKGCTALRTLDLSSCNLTKLSKGSMLPSTCTSLATVRLNNASVGDGASMLDGLPALSQVDLNSATLTAIVSSTSSMFKNSGSTSGSLAVDFTSADLSACSLSSAFKDLTNLTSVTLDNATLPTTTWYRMFYGCTSLARVSLDGATTPENSMAEMFRNCQGLTSIGVAGEGVTGLDLTRATDLSSMFSGCTNLVTVDLSGVGSPDAATTMASMFASCTSVTSMIFGGFAADGNAITKAEKQFHFPAYTASGYTGNWTDGIDTYVTSTGTSMKDVVLRGTFTREAEALGAQAVDDADLGLGESLGLFPADVLGGEWEGDDAHASIEGDSSIAAETTLEEGVREGASADEREGADEQPDASAEPDADAKLDASLQSGADASGDEVMEDDAANMASALAAEQPAQGSLSYAAGDGAGTPPDRVDGLEGDEVEVAGREAMRPPTYIVSFDAIGVTANPDPVHLEAELMGWDSDMRGYVAEARKNLVDYLPDLHFGARERAWELLPGTLVRLLGLHETLTARWVARLVSLPEPTTAGREFLGWRVGGEGDMLAASEERPVAVLSDVTLVAQWRTITPDTTHGELASSLDVAEGTSEPTADAADGESTSLASPSEQDA